MAKTEKISVTARSLVLSFDSHTYSSHPLTFLNPWQPLICYPFLYFCYFKNVLLMESYKR